MTTIAWDGTTLAADRQATYSTTKHKVRKIFDCGEWFYACSGDFPEAHRVVEWLTAGAKASDRIVQEEAGCCGIAVRKRDARAFVVQGKTVVLTETREAFFSTGSGHEYARAAMALGKNAAQAVAFASKFDTYTGMGVDSVKVKLSRKTGA